MRRTFLFTVAVVLATGQNLSAAAWSKEAPYVQSAAEEINAQVSSSSKDVQSSLKDIYNNEATNITKALAQKNSDTATINTLTQMAAMSLKETIFYLNKGVQLNSLDFDALNEINNLMNSKLETEVQLLQTENAKNTIQPKRKK